MFRHLALALIHLPLVIGYLVSPPGTPYPEASADCSGWVEGATGLTCADVEATYYITESEFETWNPLVTSSGSCTLLSGFYYCIQIDYESTEPSTSSSALSLSSSSLSSSTTTTLYTTTAITTTTSGDGITTPTPYQTGMASNCDKFYLVVSGDQCGTIATSKGISLADFYAWNPAVGTSCEYLDLGDYVCVDVIGSTPTPTTMVISTSMTTTGDGISTPTPYQTSMATNCDSFHLVVSGDECATIVTEYSISLAEFYDWNPAVGTSCEYLDLGDYVCVDVIGTTTVATTTATPTSTGNGITTPTPYQTGMATNCDNFHFVINGDECASIATEYGISLAQFYDWNPAVGTSCEYLDLGDYVCVNTLTCSSVLPAPPQYISTCGFPGFSHDAVSTVLVSYTSGSPYVESAAACGAQCLATSGCTNIYFIEGSYCNLHQGESSFQESTASGYYLWFDASCFSLGEACGSFGFSNDNPSTLITSYTTGSAYVASAEACGEQCLATSGCTNVYFIEGSYCNLHSPSTFLASTAEGYYSWYQVGCFACDSVVT